MAPQLRKATSCLSCGGESRITRDDGAYHVIGLAPPPLPPPPLWLKAITVEVDQRPARQTRAYRDENREPGRFLANVRWYRPELVFWTFFVIFWDGSLVLFYALILASGAPDIMLVLLPLLHVAVGIGVTWYVLALWLNRTTIEVAEGRVSCRCGPIPAPGQTTESIALDQVDRFELEPLGDRSTPTCRVLARTRDGKSVRVVPPLPNQHVAAYVQRCLQAQLG